MKRGCNNGDEFCFTKHDDIGSAAAEDDSEYLRDCYVDTGDLDVLLNCDNSKCVVIGRTGGGKSALLNQVSAQCDNVIELSPHSLSLNYIANNNVISFFEEAGVNLSVFYALLWKHIFVVELLKYKFNITNEHAQKDYSRNIRKILCKKDKFKEMAVDYLENWGNKFWLTTEERMQELTQKIEQNLSSSINGKMAGVSLSAKGAQSLTEEQKKEVVQMGKKVVSEIQVRELENILSVLGEEIFNDKQQKYYIVVDSLDEQWVDERIKFKLIKALIETIRKFRRITTIKIIIAIRQDLLDRVIHISREPGFQEEKYKSLYLHMAWSKSELSELINTRINHLVRRKYTKQQVAVDEIFPTQIDKAPLIDYLVSRTFSRPRDLIVFINECIASAAGENKLTAHIIKLAEEQYSYDRLQSLATEWLIYYPNLFHIAQMLHGMPSRFQLSIINEQWMEERYLEVVSDISDVKIDPVTKNLDGLYTSGANFNSVRNLFFRELYITGLVGVKTGSSSTVSWSYSGALSLASGQLKPNSYIYIHPMFYRALCVTPRNITK